MIFIFLDFISRIIVAGHINILFNYHNKEMQDDSSINSASPKKSTIQRSQSSVLTDSFRMAASVLGSNSTSKKAYTLTIPSNHFSTQKLPLKIKKTIKNSQNVKYALQLLVNLDSITAEFVPTLSALPVLTLR
jgi:hypothetical protein